MLTKVNLLWDVDEESLEELTLEIFWKYLWYLVEGKGWRKNIITPGYNL